MSAGGACQAPSRWIRLAIRSRRPGWPWTAIHRQPLSLPRDLDARGPREPVSDFGPFRSRQFPVVRMKAHIEVEDRPPVVVGAGGEGMLQESLFDVLGPLEGRPGLVLVVQGEIVQAGPVGDDRVLGQTLGR